MSERNSNRIEVVKLDGRVPLGFVVEYPESKGRSEIFMDTVFAEEIESWEKGIYKNIAISLKFQDIDLKN